MADIVFVLCAIMSVVNAVILYRGYRKSYNKLLLWSALCFVFLACNNIFLCIDMIVFPEVDQNGPFWRNLFNAISGSLMLGGLIMELS